MTRIGAIVAPLFAITITAIPYAAAADCGSDGDCKGDRICVDGRCVDPTPRTETTPATVATPPPAAAAATAPTARSAGQPTTHTGFFFDSAIGFQNPRGNTYGNIFEPGLALKVAFGWRIVPMFSLESGFVYGRGTIDAPDVSDATYLHLFNLDARFFPLESGQLEPNLLVGYTAISVLTFDVGDVSVTYTGYSPTVGAGMRYHFNEKGYLTGDFRYMYTRFTDFDLDDGTTSVDGPTRSQLHGDLIQVLVGVGIQF